MFCTSPCWGKKNTAYWCRYLVSVERTREKKHPYTKDEDWVNLTEKFTFFDEEEYNRRKEWDKEHPRSFELTEEQERLLCTKDAYRLKPEVLKWLNENIKERKDPDYPQGWCVGDEAYLARDIMNTNIFFHRKADALAFIKHWSRFKKPTTYFNYFANPIIRKELNLETNKLEYVEEFSCR